MSPKEFMFGYESPLLTLGNKFLPNWIKFDKLGLIDRVSFELTSPLKRNRVLIPFFVLSLDVRF